MAELYRKSALEKISSPEQLDKALTVTSPLSWLALAAVTLIIVVTVVWSIVGTLPVTVTASGIVVSPDSTNAVYSQESGTITDLRVATGTPVTKGTPVATCQTSTGDVHTIYSDQVGRVGQIMVKPGDSITHGSEVLRVTPYSNNPQVVVLYVSPADANKIEAGMNVKITLDSADSQTHGHMMARVTNIDSHSASDQGMAYVLGSGNSLVSTFRPNGGAVVAVTCEFYPCSQDEPTVSGYYWSTEKGGQLTVPNGSQVTGKVIVKEVRPITKLFAKLEEIWGG